MAAEKLAHCALAAVADHRHSDRPRNGDAQPSRPVVAAITDPEQEPAAVDASPDFAGERKIGAAANPLRRSETEAALRGVRQR